MNITKYPQSCLLIEKDGQRLLVDPGSFAAAKYQAADFGKIDGILLTHQHPDHVHSELITSIIGDNQIPVISNSDVQAAFEGLVTQVVNPDDTFELAGFTITAYDMPHCPLPDGSPAGVMNFGYVLDNTLLLAGDSYEAPEITVLVVAVPIAGPDISLRDAHDLIENVGAKRAIPVHYTIFSDEKPMPAVGLIEKFTPGVQLHVLGSGETITL